MRGTAAPGLRGATRRATHIVPSFPSPRPRSRRRRCARTPSPAPRNIAREPRSERRRRARPALLPRSGSRLRVRLGLAAGALRGRRGTREPGLKRGDPRLKDFILVARGGRHRLDRLELVAPDEILAADPLAELLSRAG